MIRNHMNLIEGDKIKEHVAESIWLTNISLPLCDSIVDTFYPTYSPRFNLHGEAGKSLQRCGSNTQNELYKNRHMMCRSYVFCTKDGRHSNLKISYDSISLREYGQTLQIIISVCTS